MVIGGCLDGYLGVFGGCLDGYLGVFGGCLDGYLGVFGGCLDGYLGVFGGVLRTRELGVQRVQVGIRRVLRYKKRRKTK